MPGWHPRLAPMSRTILTAGAARRSFLSAQNQWQSSLTLFRHLWQDNDAAPFELQEWGLYFSAPNGIQVPHCYMDDPPPTSLNGIAYKAPLSPAGFFFARSLSHASAPSSK